MTPFNKSELQVKDTKARDSYNFYLSQLRIRIEMAIGILVNKWRIFKKPLEVKISNCKTIIHSAVCLHNFIINEKILTDMRYSPKSDIRNIMKTLNNGEKIKYLSSTPKDSESNPKKVFNPNIDRLDDALGSLYR